MANDSLRELLREHLAWWGLRRFTSDRDYFACQQQQFSPEDLRQLESHAERKREGNCHDEIAFYDVAAHPKIFPVLYSQRYDYYETIGLRMMAHLGEAQDILDFGCGPGILTTLYARCFPDLNVVGIDRSTASIALAQRKAKELGLRNLRFICLDVQTESLSGSFDMVLATHALLQAEQDPGIPSESWRTFGRGDNALQQMAFEQRTGLAIRLDRLCQVLRPHGRMIVSEKARQLARRVPFQRALAARDLRLIEPPTQVNYHAVEERVGDGPFYRLQRGGREQVAWDESPEPDEGCPFSPESIETPTDPESPLYENHWPSAQAVWEQLADRHVLAETTRQEPNGRQVHVERGKFPVFHYLYCANTFDQRQLVIVEQARAAMLDAYYQEILRGLS